MIYIGFTGTQNDHSSHTAAQRQTTKHTLHADMTHPEKSFPRLCNGPMVSLPSRPH